MKNPFLENFRPYIPDSANLRELTAFPLIIGTLLGFLKYPEGTACAEVLKAGASRESREASHEGGSVDTDDAALQGGKIITIGFGIGFLFNALMQVFSFWKGTPTYEFSDRTFKGGSISSANDPTLLGVGYIIGPRIAGLMMGGGVLSYLVLIPMIKFIGGAMT